VLARIANCTAGCIQAGRQRGIRDNASVPDGADEVGLADDALPVLDEVIKEIEYLGCDRDQLGASTKLTTTRVQRIVLEQKGHSHSPGSRLTPEGGSAQPQ